MENQDIRPALDRIDEHSRSSQDQPSSLFGGEAKLQNAVSGHFGKRMEGHGQALTQRKEKAKRGSGDESSGSSNSSRRRKALKWFDRRDLKKLHSHSKTPNSNESIEN